MRLLDTRTETIEAPEDKTVPEGTRYAILSHTWVGEEITLSDLYHGKSLETKNGWTKLNGARKQAALDGFDYIWVDTCCIDKSSTTELSEAINSMFLYYQRAMICYAYLADVERQGDDFLKDKFIEDGWTVDHNSLAARLCQSRWFSRGWTLQEMIAPSKVVFFDWQWNELADLRDIKFTVSYVTGVHHEVLGRMWTADLLGLISEFRVAQRMSWAAGRQTTRTEDRAYSLFGILGVNIDIRYGEGSKAFERLQEVLIDTTQDQSIFAWEYSSEPGERSDSPRETLLAPSPDAFVHCCDIVAFQRGTTSPRLTNRGIHMTCPAILIPFFDELRGIGDLGESHFLCNRWNAQLWLGCRSRSDPMTAIMLNVCGSNQDESDLGYREEQPYHLGTCAKLRPSYRTGKRFCSPRLSYVSAIQARERSRSSNIVVLRPLPPSNPVPNSKDIVTKNSVWISISSSGGYDAPRIQSIQPRLYCWAGHDPYLLRASGSMRTSWSHAVISLKHANHPATRLMFAVESQAQLGALAFLRLEFESSNELDSVVELLKLPWHSPPSPLDTKAELHRRWMESLPKGSCNRLPIEKSLQLDRSLVLVATMTPAFMNGEHMVIVRARVESVSRYWSRQLSRRIRASPGASIAIFTFVLLIVIGFSVLIALALAGLFSGEWKHHQQMAMVVLVGSCVGVGGSMIERRWSEYQAHKRRRPTRRQSDDDDSFAEEFQSVAVNGSEYLRVVSENAQHLATQRRLPTSEEQFDG